MGNARVASLAKLAALTTHTAARVATVEKAVAFTTHNALRATTVAKIVVYSPQPVVASGPGPGGPSAPARLPARGGAVYLDAYLEYDGRHVGTPDGLFPGVSLVVSGGTTWGAGEVLTVTASRGVFVSGDVGTVVILHANDPADLTTVRLTITGYTSATVVTATPNVAIPLALRAAPVVTWDQAVAVVAGLAHLEGAAVGILADDHVVASPNNARLPIVTVRNGQVSLGGFYTHVYVGLPYLADLETLDIDRPQGATLKATKMNVTAVGLMVEKTRALWVGGQPPDDDDTAPLEDLTEMPALGDADYETLITRFIEANTKIRHWNDNGRVFVRSVDPVPATVLAAIPQGFIPPTQ